MLGEDRRGRSGGESEAGWRAPFGARRGRGKDPWAHVGSRDGGPGNGRFDKANEGEEWAPLPKKKGRKRKKGKGFSKNWALPM